MRENKEINKIKNKFKLNIINIYIDIYIHEKLKIGMILYKKREMNNK